MIAKLLQYLDREWARIPSTLLDPPLMARMFVIFISFRSSPEKRDPHFSEFVIYVCPLDREDVNALKKIYLYILIETKTSAKSRDTETRRVDQVFSVSEFHYKV